MLCKVIVCDDLPAGGASSNSKKTGTGRARPRGPGAPPAAPGARPVPTSPATRRDLLPPDASCFEIQAVPAHEQSLDLRSKLGPRQIANLRVTVSIAGFLASNPSADASL